MSARAVKNYKKELGHRAHRDHRTRRSPMTKNKRGILNDHKRRKEQLIYDEIEDDIKNFL